MTISSIFHFSFIFQYHLNIFIYKTYLFLYFTFQVPIFQAHQTFQKPIKLQPELYISPHIFYM